MQHAMAVTVVDRNSRISLSYSAPGRMSVSIAVSGVRRVSTRAELRGADDRERTRLTERPAKLDKPRSSL